MADGDLLEVLDAPEIAILADGPEIEARNPKGFGADLGILATIAPEIEVGRAVGQPSQLDRIEVLHEEEKYVAIVEGGHVSCDVVMSLRGLKG